MGRVADQISDMTQSGDSDGNYEFAADSPQAVLAQASGGGGNPRPVGAPATDIEEFRLVSDTDPHVREAVGTLVDYIVGAGFHVQPANIPGTDTEQTDEDIADLKRLLEVSSFEKEIDRWVEHAITDGTAFLELVVENDHFRPKVLPTEDMEIQTDEFGNDVAYIQKPPSGDDIEFEPHEVAVLRFRRHPGEEFGRSLIEPVKEQADMLRDMEIDTARFVATKAYPPIVWECGSSERPWTQEEIDDWLTQLDALEPESMLAVGHDVDHTVAGVTSTSSAQGAMRLEETFMHMIRRIATGMGIPADLMNEDTLSGDSLQMAMQKFDRRIQRYRNIVRDAVRFQIFPSLMADTTAPEFDGLPPQFEFGKHSSEEERLEADLAIRLVNNGLLSREAAAQRLGIDPEVELPHGGELEDQVALVNQLAGRGDEIQNPDGGRPTDTGGGTQSSGREVTTRDNPDEDRTEDQDRPQQGATA